MALKLFLDTTGWIALLNGADTYHSIADTTWRKLGAAGYEVVVSDWIVAETGNGIARTNARAAFVGAARLFTASPRAQVITVGNALLLDALQLYENRSDKNWGLVDCASFVIMQNEKITDAFSNDRHFQQAGFNCLLPLP